MKNLLKTVLTLVFLVSVTAATAQKEEVCYNPNLVKDTSKKSIKSMAVGKIGSDSIRISYHSPGVRNRIIWGGLVPLDEVWVTGAHDATTIEFYKDVVIGGTTVPAGKYTLFTVPGKKEWTVIINKHWQQHLASEYDQKDDVVWISVKAKKHPHTERLQYFVEGGKENSDKIAVAWEKVRIEVPVRVL